MAVSIANKRWWLSPLLFTLFLAAVLGVVWQQSEIAREVLSKAVMNIVGTMATPFVLEGTLAILGFVIVITINQRRLQKEGDGWVYLAVTEPDAESAQQGAETPAGRLDGVVMAAPPAAEADLNARLAMIEGFLDLDLKQEAASHLNKLAADEKRDPRAQALRDRLTA